MNKINMPGQYFIDNLWRWKCDLPEVDITPKIKYTCLDDLYKSEWCEKYDILRRNRMVMGTFRYGDYKTSNDRYDRIGSAIKRLKQYIESGNAETLLDVGNLCMIEFDKPIHPNYHFSSIDDGEHVTKL